MLFWEVCGLPGAGAGVLQRDKEVQPSLRFIYTAPVALPGDPGHSRSGCRVRGAQHRGGCHGLWRFWSPRIPTAGQGWDLPERGEAEHSGQPSCWRAFSQECQGRAGTAWRAGRAQGGGEEGTALWKRLSQRCPEHRTPSSASPAARGGAGHTLLPWTETLRAAGAALWAELQLQSHFPAAMSQGRASAPGAGSI